MEIKEPQAISEDEFIALCMSAGLITTQEELEAVLAKREQSQNLIPSQSMNTKKDFNNVNDL